MHAAVLQSTALPIVLLSLLVYVFVRRFSFSFSFYVILHVLLSLSVSVIGLELTKRLFHHDCSGVHTPRRPSSTPFVQIQRQSQNLISPSFFHSSRRHLSPSYTTSSSLISSSSSSPSILSFSSSFSQSRLPTHSQFLTPSLSDPLRGRQSPSVCKNLFFLSSFPSWVHKRVSRVASFSPCSSSSSSSSSPSHLHKRVLSSPSFFFESNRKGGVYTLEKRRSSSRQLPSFSRIIQKTPENKPSQSYSFISHPFISLQPFFTSFLSPLIACKTSSSSSSPPRHSFVTHKPHQTQNVSISQGIVSLSLSPRPVFFFGTVFLSHPHLPRHRIPTPPSYKECTRASTQLLTSSITPSSQDGHYLVQHVNEKSESSTERKPFPPRLLRLLQALRDQRTVKECLDLLLSYGSRLPKPGEDRGRGFSSLSSSVSQRKEERIERSDEKDGRQNTITLSTLEEGTASNRNEKTLLSSSSSCDSSWWIERIDSCSAFVLLNVQLLPYPYRRAHDEDQKKEKKREEEEKATVEREDSSCVKEDEKEEEDLTKEEEKDDRTECGPLNGVERQEERCQQEEEKEGEDGRDYREAKKRQGIFEELDKVPRRSFLSPVTDEEEDEDIRCLTAQQPRKPKVYVHLKSWSDSALLRGWLYILQEGLSNTEHSAEEVLELEVKEVLKAAGITPQSHHQVQADNRISGVRTVANESFPKSSITIPEDVEPWVRQAKQWKGKGLSSRKDFSSLLINAPFLSSEEKKTEKQDLSMLTPGRIEVEEEEQGENKETNSSAEDLAEGFEEREEQKEGVEKGQIRTDRGQREGSGQTKKGEDERHEEDERDHKEDLKQEDIRRLLLPIGFVPVFKSIQREVHRQLADLSGVRTPSNPVCRLAAGVVDEPTNDGNADASSGVPSSHHVKSSTSPLVKTYPSSSSSILSSPSSSFSPSSSCSSVSRSSVLRRFRFPLPRVSTPSKGHGREEVAVLLSGGVDSSVSLRLLQEQGYRVRAYFIKIWLPEELLLLRRIQGEHRSTPRHFTRSSSSFSLSKDGQPFPVAMKANQRNEGQLVKEEGENVEAIDEEEKKTQESCCSVSRDKREEEERRQTTPMMMNVEDRSRHSRSRERICGVWEKDYQSAKDVCDQLNVRLNVLPLQEAYWDRVVHQMLKDAKSGLTPNPDWWCNKRVKFGRFVDLLDSQDQAFLDLPSIASGHYARVLDDGDIQKEDEEEEEGRAPRPPGGRESTRRRRRLFRGKDPRKDQSYFLSGLTAQQLSRLITPVGNLHKFEVRQLALDFDLPTARRPDSQGLCFLGEISLSSFFQHHLGESLGAVLHFPSCVQVGVHTGLWNYTIGQKKGITPCIDVKRLRKGEQHVCRHLDPPQAQSHSRCEERCRHYYRSKPASSRQEKRKQGEDDEALEGRYLDENISTKGGSQDSSVHTLQQQNDKRDCRPPPSTTSDGQEQRYSGKKTSEVLSEREKTKEGRKEKDEHKGEITLSEEREKTPGVTVGVLQQPQGITKSHEKAEFEWRREEEKETMKGEEESEEGSGGLDKDCFLQRFSHTLDRMGKRHYGSGPTRRSLTGRWIVVGKHPPSNTLFIVSEEEMKAAIEYAEGYQYDIDTLLALSATSGGVYTPEKNNVLSLGPSQAATLALLLSLQQKFLLIEDIRWIHGPPRPLPLASIASIDQKCPRTNTPELASTRLLSPHIDRRTGEDEEDPSSLVRSEEEDNAFLRWISSRNGRTSNAECPRVFDVQVRHAGGSVCTAIHRKARVLFLPPSSSSYHSESTRKSSDYGGFYRTRDIHGKEISPSESQSRISPEEGGPRLEHGEGKRNGKDDDEEESSESSWKAFVELTTPDSGLAPGQIAAIYKGDECLGAGHISKRQGQIGIEILMKSFGLL